MRRILLDTNVYAAFKRNDRAAVDLIRRAEFIGVTVVVMGELLAGFRCGSRERQNRQELDQFLDSPRVSIVQLNEETAEFYGVVFSELKSKGRPIPSNDIWIAASALQHGLAVASFDDHFRSVSGVLLVVPE